MGLVAQRRHVIMVPIRRNLVRFAIVLLCAVSSPSQVHVLTANYGLDRTNANLAESRLTPTNVAPGTFGALGIFPTDGQIFAQPLYVSGVVFPSLGTRNVVFIATEHNSVYAYDADAAATPVLLWRSNLGPTVPSSLLSSNTGSYTDILPEVGILSTPTIDLTNNVIYVVAELQQRDNPVFQLHALDLSTGQERMNGPVTIAATVPGIGAGADSTGQIAFDPTQHIQRPALTLVNGAVYVAFGSHGDSGVWHGWLMSYDAANLGRQLGVFQTTPAGAGGAIWASGHGPAADDAGNIYLVTGNGNYDGTQNFAETFVKISGSAPQVTDWYTPANWQDLSDGDYDLSAGPSLIPGTHIVIGGDKGGNLYVINGDSMGNLDTGNTGATVFQAVDSFIFNFAVWGRADAAYVYVRDGDGSIKCFRVSGTTVDPTPVSGSGSTNGTARMGMTISANGSRDGILWATTGSYSDPSVPGILHAFDAANLSQELWNSGLDARDDLHGFVKFVSPTVVNGKVYAPSLGGVVVYGLLTPSGGDQPQPVVAAVENAASYAQDAISPGEMVTIFGANLGTPGGANLQLNSQGNVASILSDTEVMFDGVPAPMVYASANQVAAVVPFGVASSVSQVQVRYQGQASAPFPMPLAPTTPGLFSADSSGSGQALAVNQDGTLNSQDNPAVAGSVMVLYATGGGLTSPAVADGSVTGSTDLPQPVLPVAVKIAGQPASVLYAGGAPGVVAGVLQLNVAVPEGLTTGDAAVTLQIGSQESQAGLTVAIQ